MMARLRKDPPRDPTVVQLDPVEIPPLEETPPGVAATRSWLRGQMEPLDDEPEPTPPGSAPSERRQDRQMRDMEAAAQGVGDAYRGMSDQEAQRREAQGRPGSPGSNSTIYPAGTMPPPDRVTAQRGADDIFGTGSPPEEPMPPAADQASGLASSLADPSSSPSPKSKASGGLGRPSGPPLARGIAELAPESRQRGEVSDALRRPLYALFAALARAGGQAPSPFRSEVEGMRGEVERAQEGLDRQYQGDMASVQQGQRDEAMRQQAADRSASRAQQAEAQQATLDLRRQALEQQGALGEARLGQTAEMNRARAAAIARQYQEREAMRDPGSPDSARVRQQFADALALASRDPVLSRIWGGVQIGEDWSGERAQAQLRVLDAQLQRRGIRGGVGGGGGGGQAVAQLGQSVEALAQEAQMSPAEIAAFGPGRRDQERLRQAALQRIAQRRREEARRGADAEGVEIIPGVRSSLDLGSTEVRSLRQGLAESAGHMSAIRQIDDIQRRYGARASIDPRVEADLAAPTQAMMAMVATMRNTGIINPSEEPTIRAAIPNPASMRQQSLGEYARRVDSFRRLLLDRASANLTASGVDEAGIARALGFLRTGRIARAEAPSAPAGSRRVRVGGVLLNGTYSEQAIEQIRRRAGDRPVEVVDGP